MSIFDSLFNKLTPADKTALTAALGWLASIDREYAKSNRQDEGSSEYKFDASAWNDPKYYPAYAAKEEGDAE